MEGGSHQNLKLDCYMIDLLPIIYSMSIYRRDEYILLRFLQPIHLWKIDYARIEYVDT